MKNKLLSLESKLKRHKISYKNYGSSIIIGKSKIDYTILFLMIITPLIIAIITIGFIFSYGVIHIKILLLPFILFGFILFNVKRLLVKRNLNSSTKIIGNKTIKINDENGQVIFYKKNIKRFDYSVKEINNETYEGSLYLIDKNNNKHQILGFDDELERYVVDDLKWLKEYLENYVK